MPRRKTSQGYQRFSSPDHVTKKEQLALSIEQLLGGTISDVLFCELRDGLTTEGFAELKCKLVEIIPSNKLKDREV